MATNRAPFPYDVQDFEADTRINFSKDTKNYILEDENGEEWEWFPRTSKWVPMMDEALAEQQREAYKMPGVNDDEPALDPSKKRKAAEAENDNSKKQKGEKPKERANTAIYISSLPQDVTEDELFKAFSKFGVIAEGIDDNQPRIKMYYNEDGAFNGDALIVYFRPESVNLAINMTDDSDFRLGVPGVNGRMRVRVADQNYKVQKDKPAASESAKRKGTAANRDRQKIIKKTEEMNKRLAEWDEDDVSVLQATSHRWDKVVVLKRMFTLEELEEDEELVEDIIEDTREECSKFGEVENVVLFDAEPQGVMTVRFSNSTAAKACVETMDGRAYERRYLEAKLANGTERFQKRARAQKE
ncbi:hypothetical protein WHR41_05893 [Cladosporium halotolerans]|uniref:RRM domain-containing protein n=1 Tax=Cladosporium halotolerans TaxID=1052096 RepID=A0AB34KJL9_9PEZI